MGKVQKSIRRADTMEDHCHLLADGSLTSGTLHKPSKDQFDMHSHLYECGEDTCETDPMHNIGDHVHMTKIGDTKGPKPMPKEPGESFEKMDSAVQREGRDWVVRSATGHVLARSDSRSTALKIANET